MDNSTSDKFWDFHLEGRAALRFQQEGFHVTLQEAPDLALEFNGEKLCAEVKHFRLKEQDLRDNERMRERGDELVPYGDTLPLEGESAWEQVYQVAKKKTTQYKRHIPNILVVGSSSPNCIEDVDIPTAVNMIDEDVRLGKCSDLGRLNGILLVSLDSYNISQGRRVFFCATRNPEVPLPPEIRRCLAGIRSG